MGRPVPPHGSGGGNAYRNDPDETAGRALYRAMANAEARASMVGAHRKVQLMRSTAGQRATTRAAPALDSPGLPQNLNPQR